MKKIKEWVADFPTQGGGIVVALLLIFSTGLIIEVRIAFGKPMPDGYDSWLMFLGGLAGVTTFGMIGKRITDYDYAKATNPAAAVATTTAQTKSTTTATTVATSAPAADPADADKA